MKISINEIVQKTLRVCGIGETVIAGRESSGYVPHFWRSNIPAEASETLQDFFEAATKKADTVLCLDLAFEETPSLLEKLYQVAPRYVGILADLTLGGSVSPALGIDLWVRLFVEAGFRRHPREFYSVSYEDREHPPAQCLLFFERISDAALRKYDMKTLQKARVLHMDMLREPGRRGDAHVIRYFYAASFIRPGDTVLDCACGLGYGSHILYHNSRAARVIGMDLSDYAIDYAHSNYAVPEAIDYKTGNAQDLSELPDNSVDFITGFETIEHVPEPEAYLRELFRVLRPAGRVMLSAPDMWVDETGKDPSPHHFHVYSWDRLHSEISKLFIPEKRFVQKAGGAFKLTEGPRQWYEAPCEPGVADDGEWCLVTAMKDPLLGCDVPYIETTFPQTDDPAYHVGAFAKDYINPWLLKGMISMGFRLENTKALADMQEKVLREYPQDSVDYGAALCGKAYILLSGNYPKEEVDRILQLIENYAAVSVENPHVLRWQVSLLFVAALIERNRGRLPEAESFFVRCAEQDVSPYSPLLANKTLDALFFASEIAATRDEVEVAKSRLRIALKAAIRLSQGDWLNIILNADTPFEPGFPEMTQLMDKAARACYALGEIDSIPLRPGLAYSISKGWVEAHAEYARDSIELWQKRFNTVQRDCGLCIEEHKKIVEERDRLAGENGTLSSTVQGYDEQIKTMENQIIGYENSKSWKLTAPVRSTMSIVRSVCKMFK